MRCRQWSAVPTAKLGVCDIKIVTAYPDKIKNARRLTTTVERTFFENSQKPFCKKVFCGAFFQKSDLNPQHKLTPHIAFSFDTKGAKEKALQKENAVFMGRCPKPHSLFKKSEAKIFQTVLIKNRHSAFDR